MVHAATVVTRRDQIIVSSLESGESESLMIGFYSYAQLIHIEESGAQE